MGSETKRKRISKSKTSSVDKKSSYNVVQVPRSKRPLADEVIDTLQTMFKVVTTILTAVLPLLFMFIGAIKLHPFIPNVFNEMQEKFAKYVYVCPTVLFGYIPDPNTYRINVGVWEICAALGALIGPLDVRRMSCFALVIIMLGATLTHLVLHEYSQTMNPAVFGLLWLHLYFHYGKRMKQQEATQ